MIKAVLVASTEAHSGKSLVSIGMINFLQGRVKKVGYFKPIINTQPGQNNEETILAISTYFNLPLKNQDRYGSTREVAMDQMSTERQGELLDSIIAKFKLIDEASDFTVIEGSDFEGDGNAFEFNINVEVAKNLGAPVILVVSGEHETITHIAEKTKVALHNFESKGVEILGYIVNKVEPEDVVGIKNSLEKLLREKTLLAVIPVKPDLQYPSMQEIFNQIRGKLLWGHDKLSGYAWNYNLAAAELKYFLDNLQKNDLVITPGDRTDIITGALLAHESHNYPRLSGIVLTAPCEPCTSLLKLITGLTNALPIISVPRPISEIYDEIMNMSSRFIPGNIAKIRLAIAVFNRHFHAEDFNKKIKLALSPGITPHMFQYQLIQRVKTAKKHIVLPEGTDERILEAAGRLIEQGLVNITLLGDPIAIRSVVELRNINIDLDKVRIINPAPGARLNEYAKKLYELRKNKGVTPEVANDLLQDASYFGTMMVYTGDVDGMVSGAVNTTQQTIRPALQIIKAKPGRCLVSSVFLMCLPDRVVVFGDCAVNPDPTAEQLADIAISSAETSRQFGIEPLVALLSYSSGASGKGEDVDKVRKALEIIKTRCPDLKVDGPMQYDAAVDSATGQRKLPGSAVAGKASVFIFPDLNTGNNIYKAVQREGDALAIGPILQGLNKPVNDLSRGGTVDDIFNTVIVTAIQCQS
ncbi:MAG: phosphate acetyltransferase [Mucilaginibacter sp.]